MQELIIPSGKELIIPAGKQVYLPQWTPRFMMDVMTLWLDAADYSTFTLTGTLVDQMRDKSKYGNHANGSGGTRVTYTASDPMMNNLPTITSPATLHYLTCPSLPAKRVYLVLYYGTGAEILWPNHNAIFGTNTGSRRLTGRANDHHVWDGNRDGKNFDFNGNTYRNGSTIDTNYQPNGLPMPANMFRINAQTTYTEPWRIMGNSASYTYWNGGLAELIFTDGTENLATQQKVEGYFAWKWGLVGLLPIGHPYKLTPPA